MIMMATGFLSNLFLLHILKKIISALLFHKLLTQCEILSCVFVCAGVQVCVWKIL